MSTDNQAIYCVKDPHCLERNYVNMYYIFYVLYYIMYYIFICKYVF